MLHVCSRNYEHINDHVWCLLFYTFFGYPNFHVNLVIYTWIIDRITEFSFIIFSDVIHFMKCFILSTMDYHVLFFHRYLLCISFYYLYVNPFTINLSGSNPSRHPFFFFFLSEGWFRVNFDPKITPLSCFSFYPNWISDFTYFLFSFVCFCDFVVSERLCLFWFPVFVRCVFDFPS